MVSDHAQDHPTAVVDAFTEGGHEIDHPPARGLFVVVTVLVVLTIVASIGVINLAKVHTGQVESAEALRASARQAALRAQHLEELKTYGAVDAANGVFRVPAAEAAQKILATPSLLKAAPAPADFVHPDDEPK